MWEEIRLMDNGAGCWMTAARMGARLGLSPRTIESARQDLADAGLLLRDGKPPRIVFNVWLPNDARPRSTKPADPDVLALAKILDDYLRPRWGIVPDPDRTSSTAPTVVLSVVRSPASVREGGRGEGSTLKSFQRLADSPLLTKLNREKNLSDDRNHGEQKTEITA